MSERLTWVRQDDGSEQAEFGPWVFSLGNGWFVRWSFNGGPQVLLRGDLQAGDTKRSKAAAESQLDEWLRAIQSKVWGLMGSPPHLADMIRDHEAMQAVRGQPISLHPMISVRKGQRRLTGYLAMAGPAHESPPSAQADDPADAVLALRDRLEKGS